MNPITLCFVLIDREPGYPGLAEFLPRLRDALDESLNQHLAPRFGGTYAVRVAASPDDRSAGEIAVNIRQASSTDPQGALGWHTTTGGVPDIELPLDTMSGLTGDGEALDTVADHELKETTVDPGANQLVDNERGVVSAREACDRVQGTTYKATNGLNLSDFLLPAAWVPGAPGPYDYCGVLQAQDDAQGKPTLGPGGYDAEGASPSLTDVMGARSRRLSLRAASEYAISPGRRKRMVQNTHRLARRSVDGRWALKRPADDSHASHGDCSGCGAELSAEDVAYAEGLREGRSRVARKISTFVGAGYGAILGDDFASNGPIYRAITALVRSPALEKIGRDALASLGLDMPGPARPMGPTRHAPAGPARCGVSHEKAVPQTSRMRACLECVWTSAQTDVWGVIDELAHAFPAIRPT